MSTIASMLVLFKCYWILGLQKLLLQFQLWYVTGAFCDELGFELPWNDIWARLNRTVINSQVRDIMFLVIHNILPTRDRLYRLNQCRDDQCEQGDGVEDVEHLFTSCVRTQVAWAWCRRKIMNLMPDLQTYPSNFELIHLAYDSMMDDESWCLTFAHMFITRRSKNLTII